MPDDWPKPVRLCSIQYGRANILAQCPRYLVHILERSVRSPIFSSRAQAARNERRSQLTPFKWVPGGKVQPCGRGAQVPQSLIVSKLSTKIYCDNYPSRGEYTCAQSSMSSVSGCSYLFDRLCPSHRRAVPGQGSPYTPPASPTWSVECEPRNERVISLRDVL